MPRGHNRFKLSEVARLLKSARLAGATKAHVTVGDITMDVDLTAATTAANGEACTSADAKGNPWDSLLTRKGEEA